MVPINNRTLTFTVLEHIVQTDQGIASEQSQCSIYYLVCWQQAVCAKTEQDLQHVLYTLTL